jgi:hypothetical protein
LTSKSTITSKLQGEYHNECLNQIPDTHVYLYLQKKSF